MQANRGNDHGGNDEVLPGTCVQTDLTARADVNFTVRADRKGADLVPWSSTQPWIA